MGGVKTTHILLLSYTPRLSLHYPPFFNCIFSVGYGNITHFSPCHGACTLHLNFLSHHLFLCSGLVVRKDAHSVHTVVHHTQPWVTKAEQSGTVAVAAATPACTCTWAARPRRPGFSSCERAGATV